MVGTEVIKRQVNIAANKNRRGDGGMGLNVRIHQHF